MFFTWLMVASVAVLFLGFLVSSAILWGSAKLVRIPEATFRRALLAVLLMDLFAVLLLALEFGIQAIAPSQLDLRFWISVLAVQAALQITLAVFSIKWALRTTWARGSLAWLVSLVPSVILGFVAVVGLKLWVFEAFVIPTGGMAETLWGYHKSVTCPQCGDVFPVNASGEADPSPGRPPIETVGCTCPNRRYEINFRGDGLNPPLETGDRILVPKLGYGEWQRLQPVVFRYPVTPVLNGGPMIYVKRLVGLPGETIAIHRGKLYTCRDLSYDWREPASPDSARELPFCYVDDERAIQAFKQGKFEIVRKPPDRLMALSRLVYDNDQQARDLAGKQPPRWTAEKGGWKPDVVNDPRRFEHPASGDGKIKWLRYRHVLRGDSKPSLITDFSGYNSGSTADGWNQPMNWVGDLLLECTVAVEKPEGELRLELCKGADRFQARFALGSGECTLVRIGSGGEKELGKAATEMSKPGEYRVRFANVDERLLVWANNRLPFGNAQAYEAPQQEGPVAANDLSPAGIGVGQAGLKVSGLILRRDSYYTLDPTMADANLPSEAWSDPAAWGPLRELRPRTFYVQPGHYFCLGDNSPQSADSRVWGLVPEANVLGPAVLTYWPPSRSGWVR